MSSKRAMWVESIEAWQRSGLSVAAFCRAEDLNYPQFVYWQRALRATKSTGITSSMLVPVRLDAASSSALELALPNGLRLRVPAGFPCNEVITLARGLYSC